VSPLGSGVLEDDVEALVLGGEPHPDRPRYDEHPHPLGNPATADHLGGGPEVLDAAVGARPEEHGVHADVAHGGSGRQPHVVQGLLGGRPLVRVGIGLRVRDDAGQRHALGGVGAPRHERGDLRRVEDDLPVELRVVVGDHRAPVGDGFLPVGALRCSWPAEKVVERRLVRGHHARARTGLDRHVADRHPGFHRQGPDRGAAVLDHVTLAATRADLGDDRQDHVLRGDTWGELPLDGHRHRLERLQGQRLGREDVLDLTGADAERQGTESPVRGRVRVAADDRHARLCQPELRADDVHDALLDVTEAVQRDAELRAVATERVDLQPRDRLRDRLVDVGGRDVVVLGRQREVGPAHPAAGQP
jgi:hypothetical protein